MQKVNLVWLLNFKNGILRSAKVVFAVYPPRMILSVWSVCKLAMSRYPAPGRFGWAEAAYYYG